MPELTQAVQDFRKRVEEDCCFLSTCDGGDPGTPDHKSVWLLGIEPGWSLNDERAAHGEDAERARKLAAYAVELQLKWPFNRNAFKLLCALHDGSPDDYRNFALCARPFERGSKGFLKANLFPEPCKTSASGMPDQCRKLAFPRRTSTGNGYERAASAYCQLGLSAAGRSWLSEAV